MLLKAINKLITSCFTLSYCALLGFIFSLVYLAKTGFTCLTHNLKIKVHIPVDQLNLPEIIKKIENGTGEIHIPVGFRISENAHECTGPLLLGVGLGIGTAALTLGGYHLYQWRQKERTMIRVESEAEILTLSPRSNEQFLNLV